MFDNKLKTTMFFICGILLTTTSFLCYYLIQPTNWVLISILFVVDFAYTCPNAILFFKEGTKKRRLKAILASIVYIVLFNAIPALYLLICGQASQILEIWQTVLVYSFFTGPCIFVIILVVLLISHFLDYLNI